MALPGIECLFAGQALDRLRFGLGDKGGLAQAAFALLRFGCEHMAVIRLLAFDLSASGNAESFFRSGFRFRLWHNN